MKFYNRVRFSTSTTGTGTITVGSASTGFRTPAQAGIPTGTVIPYKIVDGSDWETGYGTYTVSGTTVSRNVRQSSQSDALLNLSGNAIMSIVPLAEDVMGWSLDVNENGTSFANFTGASGTWSSDGTVIKQTNTAATRRRAKYNTKILIAPIVFEAEIQIRTASGSAGILIGFDGTNGAGCLVLLNEADTIVVGTDGVTNKYTYSNTIATNTWYKVRMVFSGSVVTIYLDGALIFSAGNLVQASANADFIGMVTESTEAWFRNLKAWTPILP